MACRSGIKRLGFFMVKMAVSSIYFGVASYNMHCYNTGRSGLLELCNNDNIHIIAVQEHWLHDDNLQLLNSVHSEFVEVIWTL